MNRSLKFTKKGMKLLNSVKSAYNEWLKQSEMTEKELLSYANVKEFYFEEVEEGFLMLCKKDGKEIQIGVGISKRNFDSLTFIFSYICALMDNSLEYKGVNHSKIFLDFFEKYEK